MSAATGGWRELRVEDLAGLDALADRVHPTFFERPAVMAERLALFPEGCLALPGGEGHLSGYVLSYPAKLGAPPPLDTLLGSLAPDADALYLHDIALGAECRGQGLAAAAINRILALGERYGAVMLVSVYKTASFWERFGFCDRTGDIAPAKLAPYGPGARYMVRRGRAGGAGVPSRSGHARGLGRSRPMLNSEAIAAGCPLRIPPVPRRAFGPGDRQRGHSCL